MKKVEALFSLYKGLSEKEQAQFNMAVDTDKAVNSAFIGNIIDKNAINELDLIVEKLSKIDEMTTRQKKNWEIFNKTIDVASEIMSKMSEVSEQEANDSLSDFEKIKKETLIVEAKDKKLYEAIFDKGLRSFDQVINLYDLTDNDPLYSFADGDLYVTFTHQDGYRHVKLYDGKEWAKPIVEENFAAKAFAKFEHQTKSARSIIDELKLSGLTAKKILPVYVNLPNGKSLRVELPVGATIKMINESSFIIDVPNKPLP